MEWWREMFAIPMWQRVQLSWEEADNADTDADQVVRALGLTTPSRVLDVPCGTGRIARRLRTMGHAVVGIDATVPFLAVAREVGVPVIRADMRTRVVREGSFDAAFCLWGSFGYFDEDGNRAQAQALAHGNRIHRGDNRGRGRHHRAAAFHRRDSAFRASSGTDR